MRDRAQTVTRKARRQIPGSWAREGLLPSGWGFGWFVAIASLTAVIPSITLGGSDATLVLAIVGVASTGFLVGEMVAERGRRVQLPRESTRGYAAPVLWTLSIGAGIGITAATVTNTFTGEAVLVGYSTSLVGSLARMLVALTGPAISVALWCGYQGYIRRFRVWATSGSLLLGAAIMSIRAGYLSLVIPPGLTFLVLGSLTGFLRRRHLITGAVAMFLLLPTLFILRDDVRQGFGGNRSSEVVGPLERFRVDTLISDVRLAVPPELVDMPSVALLIRTALVPRILDPGRPSLVIGQQITYALGDSVANNSTFGHYGIVYWMHSWMGVAIVALLLGGLFGIGVRFYNSFVGPLVLGAVCYPALWQEVSYPVYWSGIVQTLLLSGIVVVAVIQVRRLLGAEGTVDRPG